ncbi:phosphate acyltransferase [Staphylococcus massiliensis]|uniref:Putative phosphate butyryltransferase n=1 Tax=Staphylococcus massiliensis S46 TaxID=1229783 RepID=K9ARF6_9STAP|nr:phosphate acyltransferase [Staphylococcus massiliensis]EKU49849.1 putative phosphate butyryltransferase [Staphylococcus massiliensis S46]MCG3401045.1 phosphate butyryltransferase [Staphylococcus massiliensis]POA02059.1 phosphate butyryltransferase [Staphylococcus massiliensis CCUG 55927]
MQFKDVLNDIDNLKGRIGIVAANDESTLKAMIDVLHHTSAQLVLYDVTDTSEMVRSFDLSQSDYERIDIKTYQDESNMLEHVFNDIASKEIDVIFKGNITTSKILKAVLKYEKQVQDQCFLSHVACFDIPDYHKLLMISDVALNVLPSVEDKMNMIHNIEPFAREIGYTSLNVAMLSSVEYETKNIPSTIDAKAVAEHYQQQTSDVNVVVDGPFAFDNAIDKHSAIKKQISSQVAGEADVIIVPQLDVGNAIYKTLTYFSNANVASIILGASLPIGITSRADSVKNKYLTAILTLKAI